MKPMHKCVAKRNPVFDVAKAFLMYFVILGHLRAAGIVVGTAEPAWRLAMVVGASMPCFFAISGLFAAKAFETRNWPKVLFRTIRILWPMASFGIVFGSLLVLRGHGFRSLLTTPFNLFQTLWFLRTLAIINVISAMVFLVGKKRTTRLVLFALAYVVLVLLPRSFPWYRYGKEVMHMLPYFAFGLFFLERVLEHSALPFAIVSFLFFLLVAFFSGQVAHNGMGFYWVSAHWRDMLLTKRGLVCFFGRTAMGIAGTVSLLWGFRWILSKVPPVSHLAPLGTTTLGVYAMHQWILARIGTHFHPPFPLSNEWKWAISGAILLVCHVVVVLISRNKFIHFFFFGDDLILRRFFRETVIRFR